MISAVISQPSGITASSISGGSDRICNYPLDSINARRNNERGKTVYWLVKRFSELALHWYRIRRKIIASSAFFFFVYLKSNFTGVPQCLEAESITLSKGRISTLMKGKKILQATGTERPQEISVYQHAQD